MKNKKKSKNNKETEEKLADNEIIIGIDKFYMPEEEENPKEKKQKQKNQSQKKTKDKKSQTRKKKRKLRSRIIKILLLLAIIAGTAIFALVSPTFNIQKIVVQGNSTVDTETIISLSGLQTGNNIFQFLKSDIITNIKENMYIDNVEIKRSLPETVEITVEERTVAYQIQVMNGYVYIDYQGYILEIASEEADVPLISGFETSQDELLNGTRLISDDISNLNAILKIVENSKTMDIYDLITEIIIEDNEYILYLKDEKKYIYLGNDSNLTNKIMYAQIIIENEKGNSGKAMINGDLDNGFKPYFSEEDID